MNIAQQIVNGLVLGSGYACIALGWTILLGVARLVNFAHGRLYMLGAFVTWYAMTKAGLPYPFAIVVAIVTLAALRALMQSAMMGLVMAQNLTSLMIVTLGLGYVLQGGSALIFGGNPQTLPGTLSRAKVDLGSLWFTWQGVWCWRPRSFFTALSGCLQNARGSGPLYGRSPRIQNWLSFSASTRRSRTCLFLSSNAPRSRFGAALVAPRSPILTSMGFNEVIMTFVVVVLGGIGSIGGALVAGLRLGMFIAFFGAFIAQAYTTAAAFAVLLALLVIRPAGLATK